MDLGLKNKVALVTGASKGIGKAAALALAAEGCRVCIVARTAESLQAAAAEIRDATNAQVIAIPGDLAESAFIDSLVKRIGDQLGDIDILVNNAGGPPPGTFLEHDDALWLKTLNQNFMSVVRLSRAIVPSMKRKQWGRILCVTSTIAKEPTSPMVLSASARAAVSAFTKAIAGELASFNITVNTVCPGGVQTERVETLMQATAQREGKSFEDILERSVSLIPMQRFASTQELAEVMVFLSSQRASYVTGVTLMVDGGLTKSIF